MNISVIITNHNYGKFLDECLQSICSQSLHPREVILVNDRCRPNEKYLANAAAHRFLVTQLDVDFGNVQEARAAGLARSSGDLILFVDADNTLAPDFLKLAFAQLSQAGPRVAGVYPTLRRSDGSVVSSPFSEAGFWRQNMIDATCLVRREALECSWAVRGVSHEIYEDHHMWSQLIRDGWRFEHCEHSVLNYCVHPESMSRNRRTNRWHQFYQPRITLFMPISSRKCADRAYRSAMASLKGFEDRVRVVLADGGRTPLLTAGVSDSGIRDMRILRQPRLVGKVEDLVQRPRLEVEKLVQLHMCRVYNQMAQELTTELVWIVEDDVMVPPNALEKLLSRMDERTIAVSGVYCSRYNSYGSLVREYGDGTKIVAWKGGVGRQLQMMTWGEARRSGGVVPVAGTGFGCLLIRREALQAVPLSVTEQEPWYDPRFFRQIANLGQVKLDTTVYCEHVIGQA